MRGTRSTTTRKTPPAQGQRRTADDLRNVLYSTDVATTFLDRALRIRLVTPAATALFHMGQDDLGRPLADLPVLASDGTLLADARSVLLDLISIEREIGAVNGAWFIRRIVPCRAQDDAVEGVVITFVDVTERKNIALALEAAKRQAELANISKSRFLAAASHDLRQPLQTLALLQGLLAKTVDATKIGKLVVRLDETLAAMSGMLNTLLDINQIEAGIVKAEIARFPIGELLDRIREEYADQAEIDGLKLKVVGCSVSIASDRHLLEQMLRGLVSNALKYTGHGKILVGCRRRAGMLCIEVWDTGIGIPAAELEAIFDEYHQLGNAVRERSLGLGLGLSIVKRLSSLLEQKIHVRSRLGGGSVFTIDVPMAGEVDSPGVMPAARDAVAKTHSNSRRTGTILVIEDDPEVRGLLEVLLAEEGHRVVTACDGVAALGLVRTGKVRPDILLTDYNLPGGFDGLQAVAGVRECVRRLVPAIVLTGDISTESLSNIARHKCVLLNKPVKTMELAQVVQQQLSGRPLEVGMPDASVRGLAGPARAVVYVVDDDDGVRGALRSVLETDGHAVEDYACGEAFLAAYHRGGEGCLLVDAHLPGLSGLELLQHLRAAGSRLPAIMITGGGDIPMAVEAMKAGAVDFVEKPIGAAEISASVERALDRSKNSNKLAAWLASASDQIASLSRRQHQIMDLVLAGQPSKNIAADLGISQRTVESHRSEIMKRTGAKSLPELARLALAASQGRRAALAGRE